MAAIAVALVVASTAARAEVPVIPGQTPRELEGVEVDQKLDAQVPLDLVFTNADGKKVRLGDYFRPGQPVILTLNFYRCPQLCGLTLNGLLDALKQIDWNAGEEYQIITISFATEEGPELAKVKERAYLSRYDRGTDGWHFHVADEANIRALCDAVGFSYRKLGDGNYAHPSTLMFLTPDGRVARYMNDVVFKPEDVRLALVETSKGEIGTPIEKFLLFTCFVYDPDASGYAVSAVKLMRFGGALTVVVLVIGVLLLKLRGARTAPVTGLPT